MNRKTLDLVHELYDAARPADRCPHLAPPLPATRWAPLMGCWCEAVRPLLAPSVCEPASLQLWCLAGPERWPKCLYYREPPK